MSHLYAATAITLAVLVLALVYAGSCVLHPMRDCWCCDGAGHHRPEGDKQTHRRGKVSRPCRWCRQTGKRLRIGRRLWRWARRRQHEAR